MVFSLLAFNNWRPYICFRGFIFGNKIIADTTDVRNETQYQRGHRLTLLRNDMFGSMIDSRQSYPSPDTLNREGSLSRTLGYDLRRIEWEIVDWRVTQQLRKAVDIPNFRCCLIWRTSPAIRRNEWIKGSHSRCRRLLISPTQCPRIWRT